MEGTFRKRNGKYNLRIMIEGKQRSFTAETKRECYLLAEACRKKDVIRDSMKFKDASNKYIEMMGPVLSPSTIAVYRRISKIYYTDIDDMDISKIESKDLQFLVSQLSTKLSPKSVKNIYAFASAVLSKYVPGRKYDVVLPRKEQIQYNIPSDEEIRLFLSIADEQMQLAIMLAAFGTLRRGEVSALRYRDVNPDLRIVTVNEDMVRNSDGEWIIKAPKTISSIRSVNMPKGFFDMLPGGAQDEFVVGLTPNQISHKWDILKKKVDIDVRFHDLRHYAASLMHSLGIPDQYIMEQGGWKSDGILKSVYRNTLKDKRSEFRKIASNYFSDAFFDSQEAK